MEPNRFRFARLLLAIFLLAAVSGCINTGTGHHEGYVTAAETEGVLFKTWKVYVRSDLRSSQEDAYCMTDPNVIDQINSLNATTHVRLYYHSEAVTAAWRCGNGEQDTFIDRVEVIQ